MNVDGLTRPPSLKWSRERLLDECSRRGAEVERLRAIASDYLAGHPYPGRDEYERGSIIAMQLVLGVPLGRA